jgi:hypothetical protein
MVFIIRSIISSMFIMGSAGMPPPKDELAGRNADALLPVLLALLAAGALANRAG